MLSTSMLSLIMYSSVIVSESRGSQVTGRIANWLCWQMDPPFAVSAEIVTKCLDGYVMPIALMIGFDPFNPDLMSSMIHS